VRRLVIWALLVVAGVVVSFAGPALAAADDDIPGAPLALGSTATGTVSASDPNDVFALALTEGEEVHLKCEPPHGAGAKGTFHFLVPGVSSVGDVDDYEEIRSSLSSGQYVISYTEFEYVAARSGTYYLWIQWREGTLAYELSAARTTRPSIVGPDSDDIYGLPVGLGSLERVVDTFADPDDVYAVKLLAGQQVHLTLEPLDRASKGGNLFAQARLKLLDPSSRSVKSFDYRTLASAHAVNSQYETFTVAEITYTPSITGIYYLWVEASSVGSNFPYRLTVAGNAEVPPEQPPATFPDVPPTNPYAAAIYDLAGRHVIEGYTNGNFGPYDLVTRQQFAKMIVLTVDLPVSESDVCPFPDVDTSTTGLYPDHLVAVAAASGITTGYGDGTFKPYRQITRAQVITMVVRAAENLYQGLLADPPTTYTSSWGAFDPIHGPKAAKAEFNGLLAGLAPPGSTLQGMNAWGTMPRGEVAQVLHNLLLLME